MSARRTYSDCMDNDKQQTPPPRDRATLPATARRSLNRCNLPAVILGSLTFQQHPSPLTIDGVAELHGALFKELDALPSSTSRAQHFVDYMTVRFRLHALDEAGFEPQQRIDRSRANYQQLLRGWGFNPDGKEGAVLKGWVESRFGLTPRFHATALSTRDDAGYRHYQQQYAEGIYNTNALEAQLDLIYSYCQYELHHVVDAASHKQLYRGMNHLEGIDLDALCAPGQRALLLNNINSFSNERERADEFGDTVFSVDVPREKIVFYSGLLPGCLRGEGEVIVLGGVYCTKILP
jgi:NAD+--dinitrogen-reductase ADP-D-ribosyltransferase